jgi:Divergent InlB B-repeat domain
MESPARNRALRLLVGLLLAAAVVFLIAADAAQAMSCTGSIAPGTKVDPRRGSRPTVTLQFTCDETVTGFEVRFDGAEVDGLEMTAGDFQISCDNSDANAFDCSGDSALPAGAVISGTPYAGEEYTPVCSGPVTVTIRGPSLTQPYSFQPASSCPSRPTKQTATMTVKLAGSGSGSVTGPGMDCPDQCSDIYPIGQEIRLTATANGGSTFTGWSGAGCAGTGSCTVTLAADTTVTATFTQTGGSTPTHGLHASVDRGVRVSAGSVSVTLGCHAAAGKSCTVLAELTTTERLRSGKVIAVSSRRGPTTSQKVVTLARKTVTIKAGASKTVSLSLNATGRRLLKRFHKLPARMTARLVNVTPRAVIVSKTVTFKPTAPKPHR